MTSQDWFTKDFYATLGVPKNADAAAIKKSYRALAKQLHPDRNPGNAASEQRFKDVGEAYAVLSDPEQRQQYDAVRAMGGGGPRFQAGGPGGAGFEDVLGGMFGGQSGRGGAQGFDDILSGLFGGGSFQRGPQPGSDIAAATEVSFRQAAEGATVTLGLDGHKVSTRLPVGVKDGQRIRVRGKGRAGAGGGPPGDLLLTVHVAKHPVFSTDGLNVRVRVPLRFDEAALGATVEVPTLSGDRVSVKIPSGTASGKTFRVKGKGLVAKHGTGDLLATVEVVVPSKMSKEAKRLVEELAQESAADPRASLYGDALK